MKKAFSIMMTMLFLLVSFQQALIIVHFKLNQENIEKEFCINKTKPELQCHGKCHLKKELEKSNSNDLELTSIGKKIDMVLLSDVKFEVQTIKVAKSRKVSIYKEFDLIEPCMEIFVPPPIYYLLPQFNK